MSDAPSPRPSSATLHATVDGTCSLDLPGVDGAPPLADYPLRCTVAFSGDRASIWLHHFDPITTAEYEARLGPLRVPNTTTVRLARAGTGRLSRDGHVVIPVTLFFDHRFDAPFYEEDSHVSLTLATNTNRGVPLDAAGALTLAGEGVFEGGALDGRPCSMTYVARVNPLPW